MEGNKNIQSIMEFNKTFDIKVVTESLSKYYDFLKFNIDEMKRYINLMANNSYHMHLRNAMICAERSKKSTTEAATYIKFLSECIGTIKVLVRQADELECVIDCFVKKRSHYSVVAKSNIK